MVSIYVQSRPRTRMHTYIIPHVITSSRGSFSQFLLAFWPNRHRKPYCVNREPNLSHQPRTWTWTKCSVHSVQVWTRFMNSTSAALSMTLCVKRDHTEASSEMTEITEGGFRQWSKPRVNRQKRNGRQRGLWGYQPEGRRMCGCVKGGDRKNRKVRGERSRGGVIGG